VIDGNGTAAKDNQTVPLRDGRHGDVRKDAMVVDGNGQALIPGLADMHDPMFHPAPEVNPAVKGAIYPQQASSFPKPYLAGGVTTLCTTGRCETELLEGSGFTPVKSIQTAILNGARLIGVDKEIGSIDVDKAADLVLFEDNPEQHVKDIGNVARVFKDGVGCDPARPGKAANGTLSLR
jgi:N-acetylglucosamine-6-phosphate deacetylase